MYKHWVKPKTDWRQANTQEIPRQTVIPMGPSSFIQQHFAEYWTIIQTQFQNSNRKLSLSLKQN